MASSNCKITVDSGTATLYDAIFDTSAQRMYVYCNVKSGTVFKYTGNASSSVQARIFFYAIYK